LEYSTRGANCFSYFNYFNMFWLV